MSSFGRSGLHRDLWPHLALVSVVSALLALAGFVALFVWARSLLKATDVRWGLLVFGIAALGAAYLGLATVPRWYRRASFIVATAQPTPGSIALEIESGSDSTTVYALCAGERYAVLRPRWQVAELVGEPLAAEIYRDPRVNRPVAFRVKQGLLWCIPA